MNLLPDLVQNRRGSSFRYGRMKAPTRLGLVMHPRDVPILSPTRVQLLGTDAGVSGDHCSSLRLASFTKAKYAMMTPLACLLVSGLYEPAAPMIHSPGLISPTLRSRLRSTSGN